MVWATGQLFLPMEAEIDFMRELMLRLWLELQEAVLFTLLWQQMDKKLSARLTVVPPRMSSLEQKWTYDSDTNIAVDPEIIAFVILKVAEVDL